MTGARRFAVAAATAAAALAIAGCSGGSDTQTVRVADDPVATETALATSTPTPRESPTPTPSPSPVEVRTTAPAPAPTTASPVAAPTFTRRTGPGFYADEPGGRVYNHPPDQRPESVTVRVISPGNGGPALQNVQAQLTYPHADNDYEIDICLTVTWEWPADAKGPVIYSQHDHWEDDSTAGGGNSFTERYRKDATGYNTEWSGCRPSVYFDNITTDVSVDDGAVTEVVADSKVIPCIYKQFGRCN